MPTDLSGPFDTVAMEVETDGLATREQARGRLFASPEFRANVQRGSELVVRGRNEFDAVQASG